MHATRPPTSTSSFRPMAQRWLRQRSTWVAPIHVQNSRVVIDQKQRKAYHTDDNVNGSRQYHKSNEKTTKVLKNRKLEISVPTLLWPQNFQKNKILTALMHWRPGDRTSCCATSLKDSSVTSEMTKPYAPILELIATRMQNRIKNLTT